jgi:uridine phosphorylase
MTHSTMLPNLKVDSNDIAPYAVVCGDPFRTEAIAARLQNARELAFNREYRTFVGTYEGTPVTVTSHGVGGPGAAVCFEELIRGGVHTMIRVGTAGAYHEFLPPGQLVLSTAVVREEGLTRQYVPLSFPAVADSAVVAALEAAAQGRGLARVTPPPLDAEGTRAKGDAPAVLGYGKGITLTLDAFYQGVEEFPHAKFRKAGVLGVEMENATLYVIASLRGIRAGAIAALDGYAFQDLAASYNPHTELVRRAVEAEIDIALGAIRLLATQDLAPGLTNK